MIVKDLVSIVEGQVDHLVVGTGKAGVLAESGSFPNCNSVEVFLDKFRDREVDYLVPMGSGYLEIVIK